LEVRVHVATLLKMFLQSANHCLPFFCRIFRFAVTVVGQIARGHVRSDPLLGFSDAQTWIAGLESFVRLVGKPRRMPELESHPQSPWNTGYEILQQLGVCVEVWRQLKQDGTELGGALQR